MAELKTPASAGTDKDAQANAQLDKMVSGEKKKKRMRLGAVALVVIAALLWFGVRPAILESRNADNGYRNYAVERRDMTVEIGGSGALLPADSYNIIGLVQGDVLTADFEEGDYVSEDDLLYQIDSSDAEHSIEQAEISLRNASISYENILDNFDGLEPKATVSGRVAQLHVKEGDEVAAGAALADLIDNENMVLSAPFHQIQAALLSPGMPAQVVMTETGEILSGTVTMVSGMAQVGTGGILICDVEVTVANPGGLMAGMSATAHVGDISCAAAGTFAEASTSTVYAGAAGTIGSIYVTEGQRVAKDQALMALDSPSARRQIESAALGVRSGEIALENARDILENYTITAPISGTIVEKNYKTGDKLDSTASVMAVIYDMSYLTLNLQVDELYISDVEVGQTVRIEADAVEGQVFEGRIDRVGVNGTVAAGVTTYPVRVILEDYKGLLPGMNVTADIILEEATDVLTVPVSAVSRGNTVLVVDPASAGDPENGVPAGYRQVAVELGRTSEDYIEIISGLQEGDQVAVSTATTSLIETMIQNSPMGGDN